MTPQVTPLLAEDIESLLLVAMGTVLLLVDEHLSTPVLYRM